MSVLKEKNKNIYPYDEWKIVEDTFRVEDNYRNETLFALGNGYIGMRGNFEEGYAGPKGTGLEGIYLNGFYERETIRYGEVAYGYAENSQTMLNVTNSKRIKLYIDDEEFNMFTGEIKEYQRVLSFKEGILIRSLIWRSPKGKEVKIDIKRVVSFKYQHMYGIQYEVTPLNFSGTIKLVSFMDGDVTNLTTENDPRVGSGLQGRVLSVEEKMIEHTYGALVQRTENSNFTLACSMEHEMDTEAKCKIENMSTDLQVGVRYIIEAEEGKKATLNKYVSYVTSKDYKEKELIHIGKEIVLEGKDLGFDHLIKTQKAFLEEYWYKADVEIKGDIALQQGIRFNMFHLLQSVGRDGKNNIAAKGLTGEGYEGHYFWDTEIYILPFFLFHHPGISEKLLEYRYSILDKARERARQMAHPKGALFAWRTINGEECSAYYPAGTAQYHINADVAFAIKRYMEITEDYKFLVAYGAEILFETARLWADLGDFIESKDNKFCINGVTGPDEYTAIVNNNCFTNMMARENLQYAYTIAQWMKEENKEAFESLAAKIRLKEEEIELWKKAAENMYIPYEKKLQIYPQDDTFLEKAVWDFANTPRENYPLLIHYHPLVIYRHQVCKQADLVLALFLLGDQFTLEEKKKNYDYYEKITTHDSSLSTCIFSIVASEVGYHDKAYEYFMNTARMDLDDYHGNTKHGIHAANMAGTWMCVVNGFAGLRVYNNEIRLNPFLPEQWDEYKFKINYKGRLIGIKITKQETVYELLEGSPVEIIHNDTKILLEDRKNISM